MDQSRSSNHPVLKGAVAIGVVLLAVFVVMSVVSFVVGAVWTIIEVALLAAVASGLWHMARRHRQLARGNDRDVLAQHGRA